MGDRHSLPRRTSEASPPVAHLAKPDPAAPLPATAVAVGGTADAVDELDRMLDRLEDLLASGRSRVPPAEHERMAELIPRYLPDRRRWRHSDDGVPKSLHRCHELVLDMQVEPLAERLARRLSGPRAASCWGQTEGRIPAVGPPEPPG